MQPATPGEIQSTYPTLNRRLRALRQIASDFAHPDLTPLQLCEGIVEDRIGDSKLRQFFSRLPEDEKYFWISSLYAVLMPHSRRRRLAAYFTPPHLARYAIDVLIEAGLEPGRHRFLDPASGGAAFLVPLAARIVRDLRRQGRTSGSALQAIESTLTGFEIEPNLARLSHILLADLLQNEIAETGKNLKVPIQRANTLKLSPPDSPFDAIIGNPPYGRVFRPSKGLLSQFGDVISNGYVNLYALFIEQALRWVRPGGVICLIVPMSFIGGPHFASLRKRILEAANVLRLDPIDKRGDVFLDVLYDVCVLALRRKGGREFGNRATSSLIFANEPPRELGNLDLPAKPSERLWALPDGTLDDRLFQKNLATLSDYGYIAKAGYFVWNREQKRHRTGFKPRAMEVPLYWAHNVKPNAICEPYEGAPGSRRIGFVRIAANSPAIVSTDAIILQRTSNRRQARRLTAGLILKEKVPGNQGFVSENHTILIMSDPNHPQGISIDILCRLLNTAAVDSRFRRISGSVSVSTEALRQLPLPAVSAVRSAFQTSVTDDKAAEIAYEISLCNSNPEPRGD